MLKLKSSILAAIVAVTVSSAYAGAGWATDFEAVQKEAKEKNLPILADFSGSDWCGWCIKLDKEVFSQEAFKTYAKDNVVLFLADFPNKTPQSDAVKKQNKALAEKYGIKGFPTVLLLNADGSVIEQTGYQRGGPEKYVAHLKSLLKPAPLPSDEVLDAQ
ncbi:MAG: thioredoxin family protein [Verrucomicrobia bacterium]|nr:thioredoxin family protein [Verrucomicrobiota bacterium]